MSCSPGPPAQPNARLLFGFVAMPVVSVAAAIVGYPLVGPAGRFETLDQIISFGAGIAIAATTVTAFAAVPLFFWILKRRRVTFELTLYSGAALGTIPGLIALAAGARDVFGLLFGFSLGTVCALVFWFIAAPWRTSRQGESVSRDSAVTSR